MDPSRRRGRRRSNKQEESVVAACSCGQLVASSAVRWIELPSRLLAKLQDGTLDQVACPSCGALHSAGRAVTVHDAKEGLAFLVVPDARRAWVIEELTDHLLRIQGLDGGAPGAYLLRPQIVFGAEGLGELIAAAARQEDNSEQKDAQLQEMDEELRQRAAAVDAQAVALAARQAELDRAAAEQAAQASALEQRERRIGEDTAASQRRASEQEQRLRALDEREGDLAAERADLARRRETLAQREQLVARTRAGLDAQLPELQEERRALAARDVEVEARAQELLAQARDLEERGARVRARASELDQRSRDLAERQRSLEQRQRELEQQSAELLAREVHLLDADDQLPGGDGLYELPEPKELAPLSGAAGAGQGTGGPALDIELVPGAVPEIPDDAPSLDSLQFLGAEGEGDGDGAPPSSLEPASVGGPASLDELVRAMPERATSQSGLRDLGALGALATPAPPPAPERPASPQPVTQPSVSEDGQFLDDPDWTRDMDAAWDLSPGGAGPGSSAPPAAPPAEGAAPAGALQPPHLEPATDADREATRRVHIQDVAPAKPGVDEVEARARSHDLRPRGPFERWDASQALGGDRYLALHEGEVYLCLRGPAESVAGVLERSLDLRVQLHLLAAGAGVLIELLGVGLSGEREEIAYWWVDHRRGVGRDAMATLSRSFRPSLVLFDDKGSPVRMLRFERPLEANAEQILKRAAQWERHRLVDVAAVRAAVLRPEFDRVGQMEHPFYQDAFARIESPAQSRFTLGVLSYWLQPDNRDYLVFVKSFPYEELETLTKRLLRASVAFGVALDPELEAEALRLGLAGDERALLAKQLANFAEVSLRIKPNDLDELQEWENWEALLTSCEAAGLDVDDDIVKLAERAMLAVQRLTAPPGTQPAEEGGPAAPSASYLGAVAAPPPLESDAAAASPIPPPAAPEGGWRTIQTPAPQGLVRMLADEGMAHDAEDALASMGAPGVEALVDGIAGEPPDSASLPAWLSALVRFGEQALPPLCEALQSAEAPNPSLDCAVAALLHGLGEGPLAARAADDVALRAALERVALDEGLRALVEPAAPRSAPAASVPSAPPPPPPAAAGAAGSGEHRAASQPVWSGELEALLGVDASPGPDLPEVDDPDAGEIIIDDDDIIEEV